MSLLTSPFSMIAICQF